jgi:hypothetical protein
MELKRQPDGGVQIVPEFLKDGIKFHYYISQGIGVEDEQDVMEYHYDETLELVIFSTQEFQDPKTGQTYIFIIEKWRESISVGYMYKIHGPYFKTDENSEEVEKNDTKGNDLANDCRFNHWSW